ncbi:MAG: ABC transporter substrate-binding protein [Chlamydiia bacterium]|nr:ABC transporter substrate-binding protein [Chlamydiia bacterium]
MVSKFGIGLSACLILMGCLLLTGCSKKEKRDLRVGVLYTPDSLPLWVAQDEGHFTAEGVSVELIPFQSVIERDSAFLAGEVDGIAADLVGCSLMKARGTELKILCLTVGETRGVGRVAILSSPNSGIHTAADLKGVPIAMSLNSVVEFIADELLRTEGLRDEEIAKVAVAKIPLRLTMLVEDQVAAAIMPDPFVAFAEKQGARVVVDDTQDNLGQAVLAFDDRAVAEKGESLSRFFRGYRKACLAINESPEDYRQVVSKITRTPDGVRGFDVVKYPIDKVPTPAHYARVHQWMERKGLLKEPVAYDALICDEYVR